MGDYKFMFHNNHCDFFWINDLLNLEKTQYNMYKGVYRVKGKIFDRKVRTASIFGTIVEVVDLGERGVLYHVDDGTGIMVCKYNDTSARERLQKIRDQKWKLLNEAYSLTSRNDSRLDCSLSEDDSIFNDKSIQEDEAIAIERNKIMELVELYTDREKMLAHLVTILNIGERVNMEGRLYTYFNRIQMYVNSIRLIGIKEEMCKIQERLDRDYELLVESDANDPPTQLHFVDNRRRSGIMTFDHIHHLETNNMTGCKIIVSEEISREIDKKETGSSVVVPYIPSSLTFDTLTDLNDSGPIRKIPRRSSP